MYLIFTQQLKHLSKEDYRSIKELCCIAKKLTNQTIYNIRQYYFAEGSYLNYEKNYALLKSSDNYRMLNSNMAQQILKEVDSSFKSFFAPMKQGKSELKDCRLPSYLPKDGYATLIIGCVRFNGNKLVLPYSDSFKKTHKTVEIAIPPILLDKRVKEIRIIPKADVRFFEIQYTYKKNLNKSNVLALDLGVNNLVTAVSSKGETFIIDGRRLKSINQWFNKENARLQSIKNKQHYSNKMTKRQRALANKHNNRINDYMNKAARIVINYCIDTDIGTLIVGYNEAFQKDSNIDKRNNQTFVDIPYGILIDKLENLCKSNGIMLIMQEESYTSKASFWDQDAIPVYNSDNGKEYHFNGKRIYRGQYRTASGDVLNADVNGALNILSKSNVVDTSVLYDRGEVDTPIRIRID